MVKCKVLSTESTAKDKQRHNVQMLAGSSPSERAKLGRAPIKWEPLAQAPDLLLQSPPLAPSKTQQRIVTILYGALSENATLTPIDSPNLPIEM